MRLRNSAYSRLRVLEIRHTHEVHEIEAGSSLDQIGTLLGWAVPTARSVLVFAPLEMAGTRGQIALKQNQARSDVTSDRSRHD
jgi:hypothetical protein